MKKASEIVKEVQKYLNIKVKGDLMMMKENEEVVGIKIMFKGQAYTFTGDNFEPMLCDNCNEEMQETYECLNCTNK